MLKTGVCKLCLKEKKLIGKSHILSDFLYQEIYDEKHEAYVMALNGGYQKAKKVTTSEFEGGILCEDCDNRLLGGYELYGSALLFGPKSRTEESFFVGTVLQNQLHKDGQLKSTLITGMDYKKIKLFFLSLLWRASISTRPFFSKIVLGPYEEKIRKMLLEGNPGPQAGFPFICSIVTDPKQKKLAKMTVSSPFKFRHDDCIGYMFQIGAVSILYFISPSGRPEFINELTPAENGEMRILHMGASTALIQLRHVFGEELYNYLLDEVAEK